MYPFLLDTIIGRDPSTTPRWGFPRQHYPRSSPTAIQVLLEALDDLGVVKQYGFKVELPEDVRDCGTSLSPVIQLMSPSSYDIVNVAKSASSNLVQQLTALSGLKSLV